MNKLYLLALVAGAALLAGAAQAEPTHVMIRAQALDAKFIGDHTGGSQITLTDAMTGAVLAKGLTRGGTGDTSKIMRPRVRGGDITDATTAGFEALLDVKRPTLVRAAATIPAGKFHPAITVSSSLWIIPGRDITGEGWVLTMPGLIVEPAAVPTADGGLKVSAKVSPMCGCPIEPGGIWDSANYSVEATLLRGEQVVARTALLYAGQPGQFAGALQNSPRGRFVLRLVATDARSINAGVAEQPVELK